MLYLVPCFWFLAFGFSAIAVAAGCSGTCEVQIVSETGVGILQLFCVVQMTLFTISNKLYFRYARPKCFSPRLGLIIALSATIFALAINITVGIGSSIGGLIYIPMVFTQIVIQLCYGFYFHRKNGVKSEQARLDVSSVDGEIDTSLLKPALSLAANHPDLAVKVAKAAIKSQTSDDT